MDSTTRELSQVENLAGQLIDRFAEACVAEKGFTNDQVVVDGLFTAVAFLKAERGVDSGAELLDEEMRLRGLNTRFSSASQRKLDGLFTAAMGRNGLVAARTKTPEEGLQALLDYQQN